MDGAVSVEVRLLDDAAVRAWARLASERLWSLAPRIDALNVFPVADSDTGMNVAFTWDAGRAALDRAFTGGAAGALDAFAAGALAGARGSSGVIVGAWLRGFADVALDRGDGLDAPALVEALRAGAARAASAVAQPSPGTVLATAAQVADGAGATLARSGPGDGPAPSLAAGVATARDGLARTSALHPVLAAAGVVDAGACALLVILEALTAVLGGGTSSSPGSWLPAPGPARRVDPGAGPGFEVMAVLDRLPDPDALTRALGALGDAVALTGDAGGWHTHVHTDAPQAALALVAGEHLRYAVIRSVHGPQRPAAVVVCPDPDEGAWFAAAGAAAVVPGPGPDVDLRSVCAQVGGGGVIVLATEPGCARAAAALSDTAVAAAVALAAAATDPARAQVAATAALRRLRTVEATTEADLETALDELFGTASGEVLTAVPAPGVDDHRLVTLVQGRGVEVVLLAPTGGGPAWRLGLD